MINFDLSAQFTPTVITLLVALAVLLCLILLLRWLFLRIVWREQQPTAHTAQATPDCGLSLILVAHNSAADLEELLPLLLAQRYERFEVIVVVDNCTDATTDVLKRMEAEHKQLHHSFIPDSARYVSHEKLGITIGAKAARYEWLVLTRPDCRPAGPDWLAEMAARATDDCDLVLGYANYRNDSRLSTSFGMYCRSLPAIAWMHAARTRAVGGDGCNLLVRRAWFLSSRGYAGHLRLLCGTDDLLVEKLARKGRTRVCLSPASFVWQRACAHRALRLKARLTRMISHSYLRLSSRLRLGMWHLTDVLRLAAWIASAGVATWGFLCGAPLITAAAACLLGIYVVVSTLLWRRAARCLSLPVRITFFYDIARLFLWPKWLILARKSRPDFMRKI